MPVFLRSTTSTSGDAAWADTSTLAFAPENTLIVAESGGDYTAIETALAAAVSGDTVLIYPGTYVVPLAGYSIAANISLVGIDRDSVILDAVTNTPAAAVTLASDATVSTLTVRLGSGAFQGVAAPAGTLRTHILNVRLEGGAAPHASQVGIYVAGILCEARDITVHSSYPTLVNGLSTILSVVATGQLHLTNLVCDGPIVGIAAQPFITVLGEMTWTGGFLDAAGAYGGIHLDNCFVEIAGVVIETAAIGVKVSNAAAPLIAGCVINGTIGLQGSAHNADYRISGNVIGTVDIPQAAASAVLPQRFGTAVVLSGTASIVVGVATIGGAAYNGHPAMSTLTEADGVLYVLRNTWDGSGNLTITLSGATAADRDVSWFIPG